MERTCLFRELAVPVTLPVTMETSEWIRSRHGIQDNGERYHRMSGDEGDNRRAAPDVNFLVLRKQLRALDRKRLMLNAAIQKANFENEVEIRGERMSLARALEERKAADRLIGELHELAVRSAFVRVVYKEERDIVEGTDTPFGATFAELDAARRDFRELNRVLRGASFRIVIDFRDEP